MQIVLQERLLEENNSPAPRDLAERLSRQTIPPCRPNLQHRHRIHQHLRADERACVDESVSAVTE